MLFARGIENCAHYAPPVEREPNNIAYLAHSVD